MKQRYPPHPVRVVVDYQQVARNGLSLENCQAEVMKIAGPNQANSSLSIHGSA
jgi:hypothetical protein